MNIIIKSFNRPYYLDRCLKSIYLNVIDSDIHITILEDGTNPKYLKKIIESYPNIVVKKSPFYEEKVQIINNFIENEIAIRPIKIPSQFWLNSIKENDKNYFLLLEDDMWFTKKVNFATTIELMEDQNMCMLKLSYSENKNIISGKLISISDSINKIEPKLFTTNKLLFNFFIKNKFKITSILNKLGLDTFKYKLPYYTIYNVAGVIFSKKYYSYLWQDFEGMVNEDEQLNKAVRFLNTEKNISYGVFKTDVIKTSFTSSATNSFKDINLNPYVYNYLLNEAWYNGTFDSMSGYPKDFLESDVENVLHKNKHSLASVEEWKKWVNRFKAQYRSLGNIID